MQVQFASSLWFLVVAILVAAACAGGLYYKNKKDELTRSWRIVLACLRFGFVFFLCILLMSPLVRMQREVIEKPLCFVVLDESSSMRGALNTRYRDSTAGFPESGEFVASDFSRQIERQWTGLTRMLSDDFRVKKLSFGQTVSAESDFSLTQSATDYSCIFDYIGQVAGKDRNAVVIFLSDGNCNMGKEPITAYRNIAFPFYAIGIGDTSLSPDIFIERTLFNRYAYRGNRFPVRIHLKQIHAADAQSELRLLYHGKTLRDTLISFQGRNEITIEWNIEAEENGIQAYSLLLTPLEGERNTENNRHRFHVQVLDNRKNVLILGNAPHPDLACLHQSLLSQEKYQADIVLAKDADRLLRNPDKMKTYDLVILHGLPSLSFGLDKLNALTAQKPLLCILSPATFIPAFNQAHTGIRIQMKKNDWNEVLADINPNFSLFKLSSEAIRLYRNFPPLSAPFAGISAVEGGQTLFTQNIMQVATSDPLLWIGPQTDRRIAVWTGCNLWRWRLADYRENKNTEAFDLLIDKCIQLLSETRPDNNLIIHCPPLIRNTESLSVEADLYNQAFERIEHADIRFDLTHTGNGEKYTFAFLPGSQAYELNAGFLPEGEYLYLAHTRVGEEEYTAEGQFTVEDIRIENPQAPSNPALLRNMALTYHGSFYYAGRPEQPNERIWQEIRRDLAEREDIKPTIVVRESFWSLLNKWWVLGILVGGLGLEYYLRKRVGTL